MGPVVYMTTTKLLVGALGIALTFAPEALYAFYEDQPRFWGLTPHDDQGSVAPIMAPGAVDHHGHRPRRLFMRALSEPSARSAARAVRRNSNAARAGSPTRADPRPPARLPGRVSVSAPLASRSINNDVNISQ